MEYPECYAKTTEWVEGLLKGVKPGALDDPTTCDDWKLRDLLNHLIGGNYFFASIMNREPAPEGEPPNFAEGDLLEAYRAGVDAMKDALAKPGSLEGTVSTPFGEPPAPVFCGIAFSDQLTHGWDLAKSTGQDPTLPDELVAVADPFAREAFAGFPRGPRLFEEPVDVPADASATDRYVAFLGRRP